MSRIAALFVYLLIGCVLCGCAAPAQVDRGADGAGNEGVMLYTKHCSVCHGSIEKTAKPGRRAARIASAINNNIGGMGQLKGRLTNEEIAAIAEELSLVEPPADADGVKLYRMYCASCHHPLNQTNIKHRTADEIRTALREKMCSTVNFQFLGDKELVKIAGALVDAGHKDKPGVK